MLFSATVSDEGTSMWPKEAAGAECQISPLHPSLSRSLLPEAAGVLCAAPSLG